MPRKPASVEPSGFLAVTVKAPAAPAVMVAGKPLTAGVTARVVLSASVHSSFPCTPSSAAKNRLPLTFVRHEGDEGGLPGLTSPTIVVPAVVPSLCHNSYPCVSSEAEKYNVPLTFVR